MKEMTLTDFVDEYILQELQDLFISKMNLIAMMVDVNGEAITTSKIKCEFCDDLTKQTEEGQARCNRCDRIHAEEAFEKRTAISYKCHAGLNDYVAPIVVNDTLYGYVVGGQVTDRPLEQEEVYRLADELGIDREIYWEAAKKIRIVKSEHIENARCQVESLARMISDIATNKYKVLEANKEIEAAARMKSDFLANMSHEIRTPMNAVIGMADMALMEELPPAARKHISQIKRSGKTLLAIINDILDFSKIESGKMDITLAEYSTYKMIDDVATIIATRLADKPVELIINVSPELPKELMGDVVRIKQIITNLAGNAAKFTNEGYVEIEIKADRTNDNSYDLYVKVEDSGIGIKEGDLKNIFESFQQVDSKRNRNIEGTGLGLAISEQLVELMNGKIEVSSEYEVGSRFWFTISQLSLRETGVISVEKAESITASVMIDNIYVKRQLCNDISNLGVVCEEVESILNIREVTSDYLFVDTDNFTDEIEQLAKRKNKMTVVVLVRMKEEFECDIDNVVIMRKPIYIYSLVRLFNNQDIHVIGGSDEDELIIDYIAPEAKVLIVDDNEVNLGVAVGLLEPLKMQIETALSGMEAVEKISEKRYDLIFMDHMMPEMDGVETTRVIRRFHPEYNNVPIIALTANAMEESKSMFLVEGMNDFIAKPIEVQALIEMVKNWLPEELKQPVSGMVGLNNGKEEEDIEDIDIPGIDIKSAIKVLGNKNVLWKALENYYKVIGKKANLIKTYAANRDWRNYTIEVHALKSSSRQIGATKLGKMAAALEKAGNELNIEEINHYTPYLLVEYLRMQNTLKAYFPEEDEPYNKNEIPVGVLLELLAKLEKASEELDMDGMENVMSELKKYSYRDEQKRLFEELCDAIESLDVERCDELSNEWKNIIHI